MGEQTTPQTTLQFGGYTDLVNAVHPFSTEPILPEACFPLDKQNVNVSSGHKDNRVGILGCTRGTGRNLRNGHENGRDHAVFLMIKST